LVAAQLIAEGAWTGVVDLGVAGVIHVEKLKRAR
jgi:hypothetical protein